MTYSKKIIFLLAFFFTVSSAVLAQRINDDTLQTYREESKKMRLSKDPRFIDREISIDKFIPRGQWLWGTSFSYNETSANDYKFVVLEDINGSNYSFSVSPYIAYFIKDNTSLGVRFEYKRSMLKINELSLNLSDDINLNVDNYFNLRHTYMGAITYRTYMNLGNSKRFGVFNELRLGFGGGQGKIISGKGENLEGTYQKITKMEIGVVPGLVAFLTNEVALEASVNVLGFNYTKYDQTTNQVYKGSLDRSAANFKIDIFSINIGVSFYIFKLNPLRAYGIGIQHDSGKKKSRKE